MRIHEETVVVEFGEAHQRCERSSFKKLFLKGQDFRIRECELRVTERENEIAGFELKDIDEVPVEDVQIDSRVELLKDRLLLLIKRSPGILQSSYSSLPCSRIAWLWAMRASMTSSTSPFMNVGKL